MHENAGSRADGERTDVDRGGGPARKPDSKAGLESRAARRHRKDVCTPPVACRKDVCSPPVACRKDVCFLPFACRKDACSPPVACRKDAAGVFRSFFIICTPVSVLKGLFSGFRRSCLGVFLPVFKSCSLHLALTGVQKQKISSESAQFRL